MDEQRRKGSRLVTMANPISSRVQDLLIMAWDPDWTESGLLYCFNCLTQGEGIVVWDRGLNLQIFLPYELAMREWLDVVNWYAMAVGCAFKAVDAVWRDPKWPWRIPAWMFNNPDIQVEDDSASSFDGSMSSLDLFGAQGPRGSYAALECNASSVKDFKQLVSQPVVVVVQINGYPARALLDMGSLADFISSNLAEQLNVRKMELAKPLTVQLAVQGSCSKVNFGTKACMEYQEIDCK